MAAKRAWKILVQHNERCLYFNGRNNGSPWFFNGETAWAGKGRSHVLVAVCNTIGCLARAQVSSHVVAEAVGLPRGEQKIPRPMGRPRKDRK